MSMNLSVESLNVDRDLQERSIFSAGLRVLLIMKKAHPGRVILGHVREAVMEIFNITGFTDILTIETETAGV